MTRLIQGFLQRKIRLTGYGPKLGLKKINLTIWNDRGSRMDRLPGKSRPVKDPALFGKLQKSHELAPLCNRFRMGRQRTGSVVSPDYGFGVPLRVNYSEI